MVYQHEWRPCLSAEVCGHGMSAFKLLQEVQHGGRAHKTWVASAPRKPAYVYVNVCMHVYIHNSLQTKQTKNTSIFILSVYLGLSDLSNCRSTGLSNDVPN